MQNCNFLRKSILPLQIRFFKRYRTGFSRCVFKIPKNYYYSTTLTVDYQITYEVNIMEVKKRFTEKEAKEIGEKLGLKWENFDVNQFMRGMNVELEHGLHDSETNVTNDDALMTGKIALAHLKEFPDYYDRLEKMEKEADKFWGKD